MQQLQLEICIETTCHSDQSSLEKRFSSKTFSKLFELTKIERQVFEEHALRYSLEVTHVNPNDYSVLSICRLFFFLTKRKITNSNRYD